MKTFLVSVLVAVVVFEVLEHVVLPLVGAVFLRKRRSGRDSKSLAGQVVEVREWNGTEGLVSLRGELWKATSVAPLAPREKALIRRIEGLTLIVEPLPGTRRS